MKNKQSTIVIGIMCFLLSAGIAIQIASIKNESTVLAKENTENELRGKVIELTENYNRTYKKLEKNQKKLEKLRESAASSSTISGNWSNELTKVNNYLGLTKVKGKGVIIELEEGDLLLILNALYNAGAEAVSINEHRIVFNTELSHEGDVVTIDGVALDSPYTIKAIGSDNLYGAITMPDSYIDRLIRNKKQVNVQINDNIEIEKYEGIYNFNFVKNIEK